MNHDFESKQWADNHHVLSDGIDRLFSSIARGLISLRGYAFRARLDRTKNPRSESISDCNQTTARDVTRPPVDG